MDWKSYALIIWQISILTVTSKQLYPEGTDRREATYYKDNISVSVVVENVASTTGEGPHWDPELKVLWHVDIQANDVHRYDATTGQDTKRHLNDTVSFVTPTKSDPEKLVIGYGRRLSLLDWKTGEVTHFTEDLEPGTRNRFNDGKADPSGRLWAGTMGFEDSEGNLEPKMGNLYSMTNGSVKHHLDQIDISNGLAWTSDNKTMYYTDSPPRNIYAFDFDMENGVISNQRVAIHFGENEQWGVPDGCTLDAEGKLWVACHNGGRIIRFDPQTGQELQQIALPITKPTSVCFGGDNLDELYVTSGRVGLSEEDLKEQPLAGSLFKITGLGVKGTLMHSYQDK